MRAFVRANLDERRSGIVEDLAHLPGGVGGHVDLVVCAVVAAVKRTSSSIKALSHFAERGSQSLPDWATGPG